MSKNHIQTMVVDNLSAAVEITDHALRAGLDVNVREVRKTNKERRFHVTLLKTDYFMGIDEQKGGKQS